MATEKASAFPEYGSQQCTLSRFYYKIGFVLDDFGHLQVKAGVLRKITVGIGWAGGWGWVR